jgi:hypothetical protein
MALKALCWNAHSLRNKFTELLILINKLSIDIIFICESWLTQDVAFNIPGFSSYRSDRFRGGVALFIRSSIPHYGFSKINLDFAESCTISIIVDNIPLKISSIYCSPSATRSQSKDFFQQVLSQTGPNIVAGDFNCKHVEWNNSLNDRKGIDLLNTLDDKNYRIFKPNEPTLYPYNGSPSTVDFVVAKSFNSISNIEVLNDLSSDHLPLLFSISGSISSTVTDYPVNLSKVNWKKFCRLVVNQCHSFNDNQFDSINAIDSSIRLITSSISSALNCSAPKKKPFLHRYSYSHTISTLIKNRNHYRNLYKRTMDLAFKSSMNLLNKLIRQHICLEKKALFEEKLMSLSFKDNSLFRFAKSLKRRKCSIPPLSDSSGTYYSDKDKADVFARSFQSSFSAVHNCQSKFDRLVRSSIESIDDLSQPSFDPVSNDDVKFVMQSLNPHKASGHDQIPNCTLVALSNSSEFISFCTKLFNSCLALSYFPKDWKVAKIVPLPKGKLSSSSDDFRPISLLSCFGKCFERIVLSKLNDFEHENSIIINQQCGFRSKHSTVHQILRITEAISFGFNKNKSTGMVLLDLRKAFDSVWHDGLIHKLIQFKYPPYLIRLLRSYLSDRQAFVFCQSASSFVFDVTSGVPQGSLIAPHLFNLFLNDIPIPRKGHLSLYADDTAYFIEASWKNLKSIKAELIKTVNSLQSYFHDWKIKLNEAKTEFIVFSKSSKMFDKLKNDSISFNGHSFFWNDSVKYLGIILDKKLCFKDHIDYSINKASGVSFSSLYCLLARNSHASVDSKLRVYKACIRPLLTYACPVFANVANCHMNKLQLFQNKLLRMINDVRWHDFMSVKKLHELSNVPIISKFISRVTDNFYSNVKDHANDLFSSLGNYNHDSLSFRVKHKLPKPF